LVDFASKRKKDKSPSLKIFLSIGPQISSKYLVCRYGGGGIYGSGLSLNLRKILIPKFHPLVGWLVGDKERVSYLLKRKKKGFLTQNSGS
jgi:hypothetical protein